MVNLLYVEKSKQVTITSSLKVMGRSDHSGDFVYVK